MFAGIGIGTAMFGSQGQTAKSLHSDPEQIHRLITRQVRVILLPIEYTTQKSERTTRSLIHLGDGVVEYIEEIVGVKGGRPRLLEFKPMKLFSSIAAAAVIGASFITANPAKAGCYPSLAASKMETMLHAGLSHADAFQYAFDQGLIDNNRGCVLEVKGYVIQYRILYPKASSLFF